MKAYSEGTFEKPSALGSAGRRALIDCLSAVAADLAHQLAVDGAMALVPEMLAVKQSLSRMSYDMSNAQPARFDKEIAAAVGQIKKARQRLGGCPAYMTIQ
jgi:hypothetical protein